MTVTRATKLKHSKEPRFPSLLCPNAPLALPLPSSREDENRNEPEKEPEKEPEQPTQQPDPDHVASPKGTVYHRLKLDPASVPEMVRLVEGIEHNEYYHITQIVHQQLERQYMSLLFQKDGQLNALKQEVNRLRHENKELTLKNNHLKQLILTPPTKTLT